MILVRQLHCDTNNSVNNVEVAFRSIGSSRVWHFLNSALAAAGICGLLPGRTATEGILHITVNPEVGLVVPGRLTGGVYGLTSGTETKQEPYQLRNLHDVRHRGMRLGAPLGELHRQEGMGDGGVHDGTPGEAPQDVWVHASIDHAVEGLMIAVDVRTHQSL